MGYYRENGCIIIPWESGYKLIIEEDSEPDTWIRIVSPIGVWITGRSVDQYKSLRGYNIDPSKRYAEVGPGMGGLLRRIAEMQRERGITDRKPEAYDPAPYPVLMGLLRQGISICPRAAASLAEMYRNCEAITDPSRVILHNTTLQQAVRWNLRLRGRADVVIDNAGAYIWDTRRSALKAAGMLLRPGGEFLHGT